MQRGCGVLDMNGTKIKAPNIVNTRFRSGGEAYYQGGVGIRIEVNLRTHYNDNQIYHKCGKANHRAEVS